MTVLFVSIKPLAAFVAKAAPPWSSRYQEMGFPVMTISRKRLKEIETMRGEDIDYSDIPETDAAFWADAEFHTPQAKRGVYVQLDQDILTWLKGQGPHYQARINTILRAYMEAHQSSS